AHRRSPNGPRQSPHLLMRLGLPLVAVLGRAGAPSPPSSGELQAAAGSAPGGGCPLGGGSSAHGRRALTGEARRRRRPAAPLRVHEYPWPQARPLPPSAFGAAICRVSTLPLRFILTIPGRQDESLIPTPFPSGVAVRTLRSGGPGSAAPRGRVPAKRVQPAPK